MKAAYYERCGGPEVLTVGPRPDPVVGTRQVLVAVRAASVNPKDLLLRAGKLRFLPSGPLPRIPGFDFAGEVATAAHGFAEGDRVFGMLNGHRGGATAELVAVHADELAPMPDGPWAQAASVPLAWLTALQALRDCGRLQGGQRVLIHGASGGVGTAAVQIARAVGAHVTAVCSGRNADLVAGLGAHEVIDYTQGDPLAGGAWDVVFDVFGNLSFARARRVIGRGAFVSTVPKAHVIRAHVLHGWRRPSAQLVVVRSRRADLEHLAELLSADARAVVDRVVPLEQIADAHAYVGTRRARGKVVIEVASAAAADC